MWRQIVEHDGRRDDRQTRENRPLTTRPAGLGSWANPHTLVSGLAGRMPTAMNSTWAEGWWFPGSVMKSSIKNLLIGFGVGLVLMTGLALATGGKTESSVHAPH
jgi:hypothetical protein